jgi:hypothetical protein
MLYFSPFPTTQYKIPNSTKSIPVTDITRRFSLSNFLKNTKVAFDTYHLQDGDRPDTVAYGYYKDVSMDWLVLLVNEIHDPYFQWYISYEEFNSYLRDKYYEKHLKYLLTTDDVNKHRTPLEYAVNITHHYEMIIQPAYIQNDAGTQRVVSEKTLVVDYATFASLTDAERKYGTANDGGISIYEHEAALNEDRRKIYLLDLHYLLYIKEKHPQIFDGTTVR